MGTCRTEHIYNVASIIYNAEYAYSICTHALPHVYREQMHSLHLFTLIQYFCYSANLFPCSQKLTYWVSEDALAKGKMRMNCSSIIFSLILYHLCLLFLFSCLFFCCGCFFFFFSFSVVVFSISVVSFFFSSFVAVCLLVVFFFSFSFVFCVFLFSSFCVGP